MVFQNSLAARSTKTSQLRRLRFQRESYNLPGLESVLLFADLTSDFAPGSEGASDCPGTFSEGATALSLPRPSVGGASPCVVGVPVAGSPLKESHKINVLLACQ